MRASSNISSSFTAAAFSSPWRVFHTVSSHRAASSICRPKLLREYAAVPLLLSMERHRRPQGSLYHGYSYCRTKKREEAKLLSSRSIGAAAWIRQYSSDSSSSNKSGASSRSSEEIPLKPSASSAQARTQADSALPSLPHSGSSLSSRDYEAINPEGVAGSDSDALNSDALQQQEWAGYPAFVQGALTRISRISHALNVYTGTDYSGITALRARISRQERAVTSAYSGAEEAKKSHHAAMAAQAVRQKEVVQLLERKNSWSAGDLERYMALIRREHDEEQAVAESAAALAAAEKALEAARVDLERIERTQYHEEQIWSDTIRRNSTWVTIGLMGFNVALLLLSVVVLEPWRRRRIVREVRDALDKKEKELASSASTPSVLSPAAAAASPGNAHAGAIPTTGADGALESGGPVIAASAPEVDAVAAAGAGSAVGDTTSSTATRQEPLFVPAPSSSSSSGNAHAGGADAATATVSARLAQARTYLFSDTSLVAMTRRELTVTVLQSAAVGMGLACILCFKIFAPTASPSS